MFSRVRFANTKRARNGNSRYLRCFVEDLNGEAECVMSPDALASTTENVHDDRICFVRGTLDERSNRQKPNLILSQIISIQQMEKEACGEVWFRMKLSEHEPHLVDALARILKRHPGSCPTWLTIIDPSGKKAHARLSEHFRINPLAFNAGEVEELLGPGSVKLRPARGRR